MRRKIITALMVIFSAAAIYSQGVYVNTKDGEPTYFPADNVKNITVTAPDLLAQDRAALIALYNATDGDNWIRNTNWCTDKPLSEWYGVNVENGRVTRLQIGANNLSGEIPAEIGNLTALMSLNLGWNQLTGSIPDEIWNLTALGGLNLQENKLTGEIQEEIGNLTNLEELLIDYNSLTGSIPRGLANYLHLNTFRLRAII